MRKFDSKGLQLATAQARLFSQSIDSYKGSSKSFVKTFMNSISCENVDRTLDFSIDEIIFELDNYKLPKIGKHKFHYDVMYWIGYIYRYWSYVYEEKSKTIYKIINCGELAKLYEPYHTLDPSNVIERILEANGVQQKINAVDLYRKMFF